MSPKEATETKSKKRHTVEDYVKDQEEGMDLQEIADKRGVSKGAVYNGLRTRGAWIPRGKKKADIKFSKDQLIEKLNAAQSVERAAKSLDLSPIQLANAMKTHKITSKKVWG